MMLKEQQCVFLPLTCFFLRILPRIQKSLKIRKPQWLWSIKSISIVSRPLLLSILALPWLDYGSPYTNFGVGAVFRGAVLKPAAREDAS